MLRQHAHPSSLVVASFGVSFRTTSCTENSRLKKISYGIRQLSIDKINPDTRNEFQALKKSSALEKNNK